MSLTFLGKRNYLKFSGVSFIPHFLKNIVYVATFLSFAACGPESETLNSSLPKKNQNTPDKDNVEQLFNDADKDGFSSVEDCDDADSETFPGASEVCNGIDNDCNGIVDFSMTKSACFSQGSRASFISNTNLDPSNQFSCESPDGWRLWDVNAIVSTLVATKQNYFGVPLKEIYDKNGDKSCEWVSLELLAAALDPYADTIFFHGTLEDDLGDGTLEGRIAAYTEAIQEYREIAAKHPSMKGISVDDFHEAGGRPWVEPLEDSLKPEHIAQLSQVARDPSGPGVPIAFLPYIPGEAVPAYLFEDTIVLGMHGYNYFHLNSDGSAPDRDEYVFYGREGPYQVDQLSMTASFNPGDINSSSSYTIDLLVYDHLNIFEHEEDGSPNPYWASLNMNYVFELNGIEIARYELRDSDGVEKFLQIIEMPATGLLPNTDNLLRIWVDAKSTNQNKYKDKIIQMFDWQLTDENGISKPLGLSNHDFYTYRDPDRGLAGTKRFIATTGSPWFMRNSVDATSFKYASKTNIISNELEVHERFIRKTCAPFIASGKSCLEVVWAYNFWNDDLYAIDTKIHSQLMEQAKENTTGIVFWNMPNNLHDPTKGMMAERDVLDSENFDVAAYMNTGAPIQPGWYQRWTFKALTSGTYKWKWRFEQAGNLTSSSFYRRLYVNGDLIKQEELLEDVGGNALDGEENFNVTAQDEVSIEFVNLEGHGARWNRLQYRVLDEQANVIDLANASFQSGYETGAEKLYKCIVAFFTNVNYPSACGR